MRKNQVWVALVLIGCGGSMDQKTDIGATVAEEPTTTSTPDEADRNADPDTVIPKADDPALFAQRLAAVREVVGEAMAERVMVVADEQAPLLHELELSNGNKIEWYELMDGMPFVAEYGSSPSILTLDQLSSEQAPDELFHSLSPDSPVPPVLDALARRQREMTPVYAALSAAADQYPTLHLPALEPTGDPQSQPASPVLSGPAQGIGQVQQSLTVQECLNFSSGCNGQIPFPWMESRPDMTSDNTIRANDKFEVRGVGCCHAGNVTYRGRYRTWWSWTRWFQHGIPENYRVGGWALGGSALDFDFEGKMFDFQPGDRATQCAGAR